MSIEELELAAVAEGPASPEGQSTVVSIEGAVCGIMSCSSQGAARESIDASRPAWTRIGPQSPMFVEAVNPADERRARKLGSGALA